MFLWGREKDTNLVSADNNGTIKDKMKLCEIGIRYIDGNSWELTDSIKSFVN